MTHHSWTQRLRLARSLFVGSVVVVALAATGAPVTGGVTASATAGNAVPASAVDDREPGPGRWTEAPELTRDDPLRREIARQVPVILARAELEEAAAQTGVDRLAVVNADHEAGRLDLYWKGDVPQPLHATIERVRQRFTVVVHDAAYTWSEVAAEARRILAEARAIDGLESVVATAAEHDLSGIRILVSEMPADPSSIRAELSSALPLRFEPTELAPRLEPSGWRWDDLPPWTGGAVIERTEFLGLNTIRCSTAFTARTADDGVRGVFSAKHCGVNESWRTAVGHGPVGVSNLSFSDIDVMGILWPTSSPAYLGFEGRVFNGAHNSSAKMGVIGSGWSGLDDIVCTSGGFTGNNCRQRVIDRNLFLGEPFGGPLFLTEHMDGVAAVGQGDSGGPVFAAGLSSTFARGVISAISQGPGRATECTGWVPEGRECSDWALHAEIQPVLDTLGMTVIHWSESDAAGTASEGAIGGQAPLELAGEFRIAQLDGAHVTSD